MDDAGRKRIAVLSVSSMLLVAVVVGAVIGLVTNKNDDDNPEVSTSTKAIKTLCDSVDYQDTCVQGLSSKEYNQTDDPKELVNIGFTAAIKQVKAAVNKSVTLENLEKDPRAKAALNSCSELANTSLRDLERSFSKFSHLDLAELNANLADLKVWISGAMTSEQTCLDGFQNVTGEAGDKMREALKLGMQMTTNALAMVTEIATAFAQINVQAPAQRRLLSYPDDWLDPTKRTLLQDAPRKFEANVIVAQDGSGKYKTINEALKDIPKSSSKMFVIHIKEGTYVEKVEILSNMTNVLLVGDGPSKTRITGKLNVIDGTTTYKSATVAVHGDHFIAKDIGFENSAGAEKEQAVALRVSADKTIFYNCWMDGYQDTLYTHTYRQYYRDCAISGTIDFVFGDASAVFQNCTFLVRKPLDNQNCIVTAQGRKNIRQPTGIVLQNCTITADSSLEPVKSKIKSYLARPWKEYSRTIIMESFIDDVIQPDGYLPWNDTFAFKTLFYTEFNNRGPSSSKDKRVEWPGIKELTTDRIKRFTATHFIDGDLWIPRTKVPYASSLILPPPKNEPVAASPMSQEEDVDFNRTQTKQQSELQSALQSPPSSTPPSPKSSSAAPPSSSTSPPPESSSGSAPDQAPTFHDSSSSGPSPSASHSSPEPDKTYDFGSVFDSQPNVGSPLPSSPASDPNSASIPASTPVSASGTASVPASPSGSSTSPSPSSSSDMTFKGASPSPSPSSNSGLASKGTSASPSPNSNSVPVSKGASPSPSSNAGLASKGASPSPDSNSGPVSKGASPSPSSPPSSSSDSATHGSASSPTSSSGSATHGSASSPSSSSGFATHGFASSPASSPTSHSIFTPTPASSPHIGSS